MQGPTQRSNWERAGLKRSERKPGGASRGRLFTDVEAGPHPAEDPINVLLFPYNTLFGRNTHSVHRAPSGLCFFPLPFSFSFLKISLKFII